MPRIAGTLFLAVLLIVVPALGALVLVRLAPAPGVWFRETSFSALDGWARDRHEAAFAAFLKSCESLAPRGPALAPGFSGVCEKAQQDRERLSGDRAAARAFFERNFIPHRVQAGWKRKGLLTGYYEPVIEASLEADPAYPVPLYARPGDQVTVDLSAFREDLSGRLTGRVAGGRLVPYHSRAEIASGALEGRGLELMWAKDPIDVFFLQVQGSGRARLPDGGEVRIGYAAGNGRPYTSIGRVLVEAGALDEGRVSLFAIRDWLEDNPERLADILNRNQSYVFFRIFEGDGPLGSAGAVLTPGRSLAVDPAHLPLGLPVWVAGEMPSRAAPFDEAEPFSRLMIAQDTGGAIRGAIRGDVFFGAGAEAEWYAGHMQHQAVFTVLMPKPPGRE